MSYSNIPAPNLATSAFDMPVLAHGADENRAFCDGGIFIEGLKDRVCPMCGAGPADEPAGLHGPGEVYGLAHAATVTLLDVPEPRPSRMG